jgi:methanogenic corrinoid protein MtbC1
MKFTDVAIGDAIKVNMKSIAIDSYNLQVQKMPELNERATPIFVEKSIRDTEYTLLYLSDAIRVSSPKLFADYVLWFVDVMKNIPIPIKYLVVNLECISETIKKYFDMREVEIIRSYIKNGLDLIESSDEQKNEESEFDHPLKKYRSEYIRYLLNAERHKANALVQELVRMDYSVQDIYLEIFHESQYEIGRLWQANKITIAEEHYCTASTQLIMGQLYPLIFATPKNDLVFVGACVGGELHELGVRMVSDFMELAGWNTYYLGANMPVKSVVETLIKEKANVFGLSVTMSFHIKEAVDLIKAIKDEPLCAGVKIVVGGYPFIVDDQLWRTIGADGFARNAKEAVEISEKLVEAGGAL